MADIYLYLQGDDDECDMGCDRHWILVFHYKSENGGRIIMYDCDTNNFGYPLHRVREQIPPICRDIRLVVCDFPVTPEEMENAARENIVNGHVDVYDEDDDDSNCVCIKWAKALCASRGIPSVHMSKCEDSPSEAYAVDAEGKFVCEAHELYHHYFVSEFDLS